MILSKTAKVRVNYANAKYYEDKGYSIPMKKASLYTFQKTGKEYTYDTDAYIEVNVEDLPKGSKALLDVTCDICNIPKSMKYCDYNKSISTQGFHVCPNCVSVKIQKTVMERYNVPNASMLPKFQEKAKETSRKKYGCDFPMQNKKVREQAEQTCYEKYGQKHALQVPEIKEKARETFQKKYNANSPFGSSEIREKIAKTCEERYGYKNPKQSPIIKEKIRNNLIEKYGKPSCYTEEVKEKRMTTCQQKYGVDFPLLSEEINQKAKETNKQKYGYEYASQSPEIKKKKADTFYKNGSVATSSQQRYIQNLYGGILNGVVANYNCDIVFEEEKLIVEIDFSGHNLSVKLGNMTEEEFKQKEIVRSSIIKRAGYKTMRIISRHDYLPSDSTLLNMLQYARDYFASNPNRSWISFDIDNKVIYNAYHKESELGLPYDYGKLRKIKNINLEQNNLKTNRKEEKTYVWDTSQKHKS